MLKEILWLLAGYLAIIGLVRVVAVLVDLIAPPKAPQGCRLYLRVPEDADYTESSLIGCCRLLHRGETAGCPAPCCCRRRQRRGRSAGGTVGIGILIYWICPMTKKGV